jgi:hypothetical protein
MSDIGQLDSWLIISSEQAGSVSQIIQVTPQQSAKLDETSHSDQPHLSYEIHQLDRNRLV